MSHIHLQLIKLALSVSLFRYLFKLDILLKGNLLVLGAFFGYHWLVTCIGEHNLNQQNVIRHFIFCALDLCQICGRHWPLPHNTTYLNPGKAL